MLHALIYTTLPVFGIIFCGYVVTYFGILGPETSDIFNRFVYFLAFPALLFTVISRTPADQIFDWPFVSVWLASLLVTFAITAAISRFVYPGRLAVLSMRCLNCTCASTAFMGIPLAVAAFGQEAALPAVVATIVLATVIVSLTIFLIEADRSSEREKGQVLRGIAISLAKNPLMIASGLGILMSAVYGRPPAAVERLFDLVADTAIPLSLFSLGLFIAAQSIREEIVEISLFTFVKLVVHPLVTWVLLEWVFDLDPFLAGITLLMAALPPASTCFVIAQRFDTYVGLTSSVTIVSTVVSVITLSVLLALLGVS